MRWLLLFLLLPLLSYGDDTAALQALINAHAGGTLTLPATTTYFTSAQLIAPAKTHIQMSGDFIVTSQTTASAIKLNAGCTLTSGTIQGPWVYTTPGSSSGGSGVQVVGAGVTITNMRVLSFAGYGIIAGTGAGSNLTVTNNEVTKCGYILFMFNPATNGTSGGIVTGNTFDNSALAPSNVTQLAVGIRSSDAIHTDTTSGWTISHNIIKMPFNPPAVNAECMEVRLMKNSTIAYNTFTQGSIGISVAQSRGIIISHNHTVNSGHEGIEFADSHDCSASDNNINGSQDVGILIDKFFNVSRKLTLSYDTITNCTNSAIHATNGTHNFTFNYVRITTSTIGIYMQQADTLTTNHCDINGNSSPGTIGYYDASAPGNITINSGAIRNCTSAVKAYNITPGAVVDNIVGTNVSLSGTLAQFTSFFTNGAHYGTNVRFIIGFFTYPAIAGVIYGATNFDAGATSNLAITYTTTGHYTTIVSGLVHITGAGTDTITATTTDTSAAQPVVISKKAVVITADNKVKVHGAVNPALTFSYSTLAYGENNSVWGTQPTVVTTAVMGSPIGVYAITASGAVAANYSFSYVPGVLTVLGSGGSKQRWGRRVH